MDEVLSAFLAECQENLEKLDNELVFLEKDPQGSHVQDSLAKIFRTVHTIKGSCGWLGLVKLEAVVHDGEELLVALREAKIPVTTEIVSTLLEMFDAIRAILLNIKETEQEGDTDYSELIQTLKQLMLDPHYQARGQIRAAEISAELPPETVEIENLESEEPHLSEELSETAPTLEKGANRSQRLNLSEGSIRVDVGLLDKLMNLVGELVLSRNQILQINSNRRDAGFSATAQHLNLITSELQEGVMKTRMQMIGTVWNKFPRVVRDLALEGGKEIEVQMDGQETELDRTIIEAIQDPLMHIIRNAVDHGMETPQERRAQGKNPVGRLRLQAYHEGGHVNISISDDGRGINAEKVREKALQKGLLSLAELSQLNERALLNLIFLPGFSTAEKVTNISGRGVGMDVVRSNIEEVGGFIDLYSQPGKGTTFKIKIPLTLAIIPALMVKSGGEHFAIPQMNLLELLSLEGEQVRNDVEMVYNTPIYRLRGDILPLVCLREQLGMGSYFQERQEALARDSEHLQMNIIVLQADEQRFGLLVDEISDTEEIVVKPLSKQLKALSVYAGATILGTGKVALILDVMGLAKQAQLLSEVQQLRIANALQRGDENLAESHSLLLFQATANRNMCLPISLVARLEEFDASEVQTSGELQVIQYRKRILPLIFLSEIFPAQVHEEQTNQSLSVIVCSENGNLAGIVVHQIMDIVETGEDFEIQYAIQREGIQGSVILNQQVMDILDFRSIILKKLPAFFNPQADQKVLVGVS